MLLDALLPRALERGPDDDFWYRPVGAKSAIGQAVSQETALGVTSVWAATNKIASALASLPCKTYQQQEVNRNEAIDHPLYYLLHSEPNPDMDSYVFWEMLTQWWVNRGNAFAEIERAGGQRDGQVIALWPIHPSRMCPEWNEGGTAFRWRVRNNTRDDVWLETHEVLNIVGVLSSDGIFGKGVIDYLSHAIGVAMAQDKYRGAFFTGGGQPPGVLKHPSKLDKVARENLRREWKQIHASPEGAQEIAVLWEGMEYMATGVDAEKAQMIKSSEFSVTEMARAYDLPPHVLADLTRATFSNIDSQQISLVVDSYRPRIVRVEKSMQRQLLTADEKKAGYYFRFNVDGMLRGDPKARAETNQIKLQNGRLTINEWLAQDEQNPIADDIGNARFIPANFTTVERLVSGADVAPAVPAPPVENAEPDAKTRAAAYRVAAGAVERLLRKESNEARRAATKPDMFLAWLDSFYGKYAETFAGAVCNELALCMAIDGLDGDPVNVSATVAARHVARSREDLLSAAECPPACFAERVESVTETWLKERTKLELESCVSDTGTY